jgi:hypothetical protein
MNNCSFKRWDILKTVISSCHSKHCFKSIPLSQAIMVKRICSTVETTKQRLRDLRNHLKRQEYHDKVIKNGFSKASENNRNDLMEYKEKKINKRVPLLLTCHPSLEKISGIVRHHWKEIEKSETLAKLFPEPPVVAFWQPKRITDTLRYIDLHRRSASVSHAVTSVASAVSNCNTHKFFIARRQESSIRSFAMSIAKNLMRFTTLTATSAGRNT